MPWSWIVPARGGGRGDGDGADGGTAFAGGAPTGGFEGGGAVAGEEETAMGSLSELPGRARVAVGGAGP